MQHVVLQPFILSSVSECITRIHNSTILNCIQFYNSSFVISVTQVNNLYSIFNMKRVLNSHHLSLIFWNTIGAFQRRIIFVSFTARSKKTRNKLLKSLFCELFLVIYSEIMSIKQLCLKEFYRLSHLHLSFFFFSRMNFNEMFLPSFFLFCFCILFSVHFPLGYSKRKQCFIFLSSYYR